MFPFPEQLGKCRNKRKRKTYAKLGKLGSSSTGSTTSSQVSTSEMKNILEKLHVQSHRDSTRLNYYSIWKALNSFYLRLDIRPQSWEERLTLYIAYLIDKNRQSSTIRSYISAIKYVLREDGFKIHEDELLIASLTRACKLKNDVVHARLPIQKDMLQSLLRKIDVMYLTNQNQPYLALLYKTLFSTAYYGLFRVGELATGDHPVLARDVHIAQNKAKMLFILHTSKTHWKNDKPQMVKITSHRAIDKGFCPFALLRQFASQRGPYRDISEPFFIFCDRQPVKPDHMRICLRSTIKMIGLNEQLYSVHSLRVRRSSDLFLMGLSVETIKKLGHWKSNTVYRYLR